MIETETSYGYTGRDGTCHSAGGVTEVKGFKDVTTKSADALKAAVAEGPVSVAIDAAGIGFQLYFGGIMKHFCGTSLDHGVLVVGYGSSSSGEDYWILKNSWGGGWGEKDSSESSETIPKLDHESVVSKNLLLTQNSES